MFHGSITAIVTPFDERGEIDLQKFHELIEWQIVEGTSGLVIAGATGEGATLTSDEKVALFRRAVEVAKGRVPVIATTGSNSTRATVELTQAAKAVGVSGTLIVFPYYNKPTIHGCKAHVEAVAAVGLPMILYHHPGRTGIKFTASQLAMLSKISPVQGIKESSGDLGLVAELLSLTDVNVLCGDDILVLPFLSIGANGNISIASNIMPSQMAEMIGAARAGDFGVAREIFRRLTPLFKSLNTEINPQGIKCAMGVAGKCSPSVRLPLTLVEKSTQSEIEKALESAIALSVR